MHAMLPFVLFFSASALAGGEARTLAGVARDAKGRALLEADDGAIWTVRGLESWPDGVSGQRVEVRGRPGEAHVLPEAVQDADGAWSQGVAPGSAPDRVLTDSAWVRLPPAAGPWQVEVRTGDATWTARRTGDAMDYTGPGGAAGVVKPPGARQLFAAIGRAQAAPGATGRGADTLEIRTSGAAGEGGARIGPGPAADAVRAALVSLGDPQ